MAVFSIQSRKSANTKLLIYHLWYIIDGLTSLSVLIIGSTTINAQQKNSLAIISANIFRGAEIFVWLVFLKRLEISFSNTKYQSSEKIYYIFYILIFIFIVSDIIYSIMHIVCMELDIDKSPKAYDIDGEIHLWLQQVIDLLMTAGLLYLYSNKLYRLTMEMGMRDPSQLEKIKKYSTQTLQNCEYSITNIKATIGKNGDYEYQRDESKKDSDTDASSLKLIISFNQGQEKILRVMSKISILSSFAIVFVQIIALYLAILYSLFANHFITLDQFINCQSWLLFISAFGVIINVVCMFLSFDFVSKYYYKWCGVCDKCCFHCCTHIVATRIKKHVIKQTELGQPLLTRGSSALL